MLATGGGDAAGGDPGPGGKWDRAREGDGRTIRLWDPVSGREIRVADRAHVGSVHAAWPSAPTARGSPSAGADRMVRLWDPDSGRTPGDLRGALRRRLRAGLQPGRLAARLGRIRRDHPDLGRRYGSDGADTVGSHQLGARPGLHARWGSSGLGRCRPDGPDLGPRAGAGGGSCCTGRSTPRSRRRLQPGRRPARRRLGRRFGCCVWERPGGCD